MSEQETAVQIDAAEAASPAGAESGQESGAEFSDRAPQDQTDGSGARGVASNYAENDAEAGQSNEGTGERNRARDTAEAQKRRDGQQGRAGRGRVEDRSSREMEAVREEARVNAIIEAHDGVNPFNGKPMKDAADVRTYLTMKEISRAGGDPVSDFAEYTAREARESAERENAERERREWFASDRQAFMSAYPDVDVDALIRDREFSEYAEGKIGKRSLADIYARYNDFVGRQPKRGEEAANRRAAQTAAQKAASPGSLTGQGAEPRFTREQVKAMSQKEVHDNYDAIMESSKYW